MVSGERGGSDSIRWLVVYHSVVYGKIKHMFTLVNIIELFLEIDRLTKLFVSVG